jgi:hypothetical protein
MNQKFAHDQDSLVEGSTIDINSDLSMRAVVQTLVALPMWIHATRTRSSG